MLEVLLCFLSIIFALTSQGFSIKKLLEIRIKLLEIRIWLLEIRIKLLEIRIKLLEIRIFYSII